jgi:hypothetical protein
VRMFSRRSTNAVIVFHTSSVTTDVYNFFNNPLTRHTTLSIMQLLRYYRFA